MSRLIGTPQGPEFSSSSLVRLWPYFFVFFVFFFGRMVNSISKTLTAAVFRAKLVLMYLFVRYRC